MSGPDPEPEWWHSLAPEPDPPPWWRQRRVRLAAGASALIIAGAAGYLLAGPGSGSDGSGSDGGVASPVGAINRPAESEATSTDGPTRTSTASATPASALTKSPRPIGTPLPARTTRTRPPITTTAGVTVPDVVDMNRAAAENRLKSAGFAVKVIPVDQPDLPVDVVASQEPGAGTVVGRGSTVSLHVSVEVTPSDTPSPTSEATATGQATGQEAVR